MKSKEWSTIAIIVVISAFFSFFIANFLFGNKPTNILKVEVVQPISADFPLPNEKYFNGKSLNPTQEIKIGEDTNKTPFNGR